MKTLKEILGRQVRELRERAKMNQIDLAERSGLARQVINNIESGKVWPIYSTIQAIAGALECPESDLLSQNMEASTIMEKLNEMNGSIKTIAGIAKPANVSGKRAELLDVINDIPTDRIDDALLFLKTFSNYKSEARVPKKRGSKVSNRGR